MEEKKRYPKIYTKNKQSKNGRDYKEIFIILDDLFGENIFKTAKGEKAVKILLFSSSNSQYSDDSAIFSKPQEKVSEDNTEKVEKTFEPQAPANTVDPTDLPF